MLLFSPTCLKREGRRRSMFGKLDYGWALDVLVVWVAFRVLMTVVRGIGQALTLGRFAPVSGRVVMFYPLISALVFALAFCLAWHWVFPGLNALIGSLLSVGGFLVGFASGFVFDFFMHLGLERWIGVR